jgi:hypothetical protein
LQGLITNNATVRFRQSGDGTYAGVMEGTGALQNTAAGLYLYRVPAPTAGHDGVRRRLIQNGANASSAVNR